MKKWWIFIVLGMAVVVALAFAAANKTAPARSNQTESKGMKITSTAFDDGKAIPIRYGCQGEGVNPPLALANVPGEAQALALVVDDPDAPGGTFDHWVLWNLPATTREIPENWEPEPGVSVGANGAGKSSWYPPCPPSGTHHYHFKLYALDQKLNLAEGSSKGELEKAMQGHTVTQAELVGTYSKQ